MGIVKKGILGGFSGKVGAVVDGSWKGISYMRSLPQNITGLSLYRKYACGHYGSSRPAAGKPHSPLSETSWAANGIIMFSG
jgi:hypothetical protein